jgi:hypothetical protein
LLVTVSDSTTGAFFLFTDFTFSFDIFFCCKFLNPLPFDTDGDANADADADADADRVVLSDWDGETGDVVLLLSDGIDGLC